MPLERMNYTSSAAAEISRAIGCSARYARREQTQYDYPPHDEDQSRNKMLPEWQDMNRGSHNHISSL